MMLSNATFEIMRRLPSMRSHEEGAPSRTHSPHGVAASLTDVKEITGSNVERQVHMTVTGDFQVQTHPSPEHEAKHEPPAGAGIVVQRSYTSKVRLVDGVVVKTVDGRRFRQYKLAERERCVLKMLQKFPWCPRLLPLPTSVAGDPSFSLAMSFAGAPVNSSNIPQDYKVQAKRILQDMASVGVQHRDI